MNIKQIGVLSIILILIGILVYLYVKNESLYNDYVKTTNELAEKDRVHKVDLEKYGNLSERYAKINDNLNSTIEENKKLNEYVQSQKGKLLSLTHLVQQFSIENQVLKGKFIEGEDGQRFAEFDSTNDYYKLKARVDCKYPILFLSTLEVYDSSYVGIMQTDNKTFLKGFVKHSNPYIQDRNAEFSLSIERETIGIYTIPWLEIGISFGVGAILGYLIAR